mmetsp:Transcript_42394/g.134715  ORF Transcript_42394/g.134715 Transcript_42394/m.134715 type:complete len:230 (-) Transcript_42394:108-797(-)
MARNSWMKRCFQAASTVFRKRCARGQPMEWHARVTLRPASAAVSSRRRCSRGNQARSQQASPYFLQSYVAKRTVRSLMWPRPSSIWTIFSNSLKGRMSAGLMTTAPCVPPKPTSRTSLPSTSRTHPSGPGGSSCMSHSQQARLATCFSETWKTNHSSSGTVSPHQGSFAPAVLLMRASRTEEVMPGTTTTGLSFARAYSFSAVVRLPAEATSASSKAETRTRAASARRR